MKFNILSGMTDEQRMVVDAFEEQSDKFLKLPPSVSLSFQKTKMKGCFVVTQNKVILSNQLTLGEMCIIMAHELIHCEQTFLGLLKWSRWKKKLYWTEKTSEDQPWETDARARQEYVAQNVVMSYVGDE